MSFAIALSRENLLCGSGGPFGAAIFNRENDSLICCAVNRVEEEGFAIAHAELLALSLAQAVLGTHDLGPHNLELVSSSQPCIMCYGASIWSGIGSILIGARREDVEALTGFDEGPLHADWLDQLKRRGIHVSRDILREEACAVLRDYKKAGSLIYNSSANKLTS